MKHLLLWEIFQPPYRNQMVSPLHGVLYAWKWLQYVPLFSKCPIQDPLDFSLSALMLESMWLWGPKVHVFTVCSFAAHKRMDFLCHLVLDILFWGGGGIDIFFSDNLWESCLMQQHKWVGFNNVNYQSARNVLAHLTDRHYQSVQDNCINLQVFSMFSHQV